MLHKRRKRMASLFNSRLNSKSKLFQVENCAERKTSQKNAISSIIKFIIIISCVILFVFNSYAIFIEFDSDPIIISTKVEKSYDRSLQYPLILICNESAFKEPVMSTDFDGYRNNTMALDDFLIDIIYLENAGHAISDVEPESIKHKIEEVFTAFHGTCFLVRENNKTTPESVIFMELNANFDLKIYLINPGDEIFAPMNIWPISPPEQRLSSKNVYSQIELIKESKISRKNCTDDVDYVYGDCIRDQLKQFFEKDRKELFTKCQVPWTVGLINITLEEAKLRESCDIRTATHQSLKLLEFFYRASAWLFPTCKAPCYTSTYKIQASQFEKTTAIANFMAENYRRSIGITKLNNTETYSVVINYETSDVVVSEEIHLTTLPDFISSVGGNLGLFIGFSCLPVLLKATEFFRNLKISNVMHLTGLK